MVLSRSESARGKLGVVMNSRVPGSTATGIERIGDRQVMLISSTSSMHRGALLGSDGRRIAAAVKSAIKFEIPIVMLLSTSGASIHEGIEALHGWGVAARELANASGIVPIICGLFGPAVSGPALLLGLSDVVVTTPEAYAFVTGPDMVRDFTGMSVSAEELGGTYSLAVKNGTSHLEATDYDEMLEQIEEVLEFLPSSTNQLPPFMATDDPVERYGSKLDSIIPASPTGSYDVRDIIMEIADDEYFFELRSRFAPQLVVGLARIGGNPVGILANQPRVLAGTLDIPASQKGARFVRFCDAFNLPLITLEDTPGFLPGKDVEWRGMIRHGAELAFAYASCGVPRMCIILRKAYGGAYIVMDSKGMGSDVVFAWPSAEIAVMGAQGAAQILMRRATAEERLEYQTSYEKNYLTPYVAAERGFVDEVIEPGMTRTALASALELVMAKKERIRKAKHANSPM